MLDPLLRILLKLLLSLRYRVGHSGLEEIAARGRQGILFLPNHPALIDPVILGLVLHHGFAPRFLADREVVDRPFLRFLARRLRFLTIRDAALVGTAGRRQAAQVLQECAAALAAGDNLVLYPSGRIYRRKLEDLRGNSGAHQVLAGAPGCRVVLVRTRGLWGSAFSRIGGGTPKPGRVLLRGLGRLLLGGIFFAPRRPVEIDFQERQDLTPGLDRQEFNRRLESHYNREAMPARYVPYTNWERGGPRDLPDPAPPTTPAATAQVPADIRREVTAKLAELSGREHFADQDRLAHELGLDSLAQADLLAWLEGEYGAQAGSAETLRTVAHVLAAACGQGSAAPGEQVAPPPPRWTDRPRPAELVELPRGEKVTDLFLAAARRAPGRVVLADTEGRTRSYRQVITAIMVLCPCLSRLPGTRVGIMLPASIAADTLYLALLLAGKTPVMINWTGGPRNLAHALDLTGTERVLTSARLTTLLAGRGTDLSPLRGRTLALEDLARKIPLRRKLGAAILSRLTWRSLRRAPMQDQAVILFTSGSESLPKAVPLSQANLVANLRDLATLIPLAERDSLLGMLPPFHSFGLTVGVLFPLCLGIPVIHHPGPTEGAALAAATLHYQPSLIIGTPTFLRGILQAAGHRKLTSPRLLVTGAEKCPPELHRDLARQAPAARVLEGYGITECSPVVAVNDYHDPRPGTIGRILPSLEYALKDTDADRPAPPGGLGLLLVRGPSVFAGYLGIQARDPFLSFAGKQWYDTGDLVQEEQGVLTFRGRQRRFVKIGGEMISLPAIEDALQILAEPDAEAPQLAVSSRPGPDRTVLVLYTTLHLTRQQANSAIARAGLSGLHNIRQVVQVEEIPLLGTGKVDYRSL